LSQELNQDKEHREKGSHNGGDSDDPRNREFTGKWSANEGFYLRIWQDTHVSSLFQKRPAGFKGLTSSLGIEDDVSLSRVGKCEISETVVRDPAYNT
jgi:hypothetical protein